MLRSLPSRSSAPTKVTAYAAAIVNRSGWRSSPSKVACGCAIETRRRGHPARRPDRPSVRVERGAAQGHRQAAESRATSAFVRRKQLRYSASFLNVSAWCSSTHACASARALRAILRRWSAAIRAVGRAAVPAVCRRRRVARVEGGKRGHVRKVDAIRLRRHRTGAASGAEMSDTYWCLTGVPERMAIAAARFERFGRGGDDDASRV